MKAASRQRDTAFDKDQQSVLTASVRNENGTTFFTLSGRLSRENLEQAQSCADQLFPDRAPTKLIVELGSLHRVDTAGALFLARLEQTAHSRGVPFEFRGMSSRVAGVLDLIDCHVLETPPATVARPSLGVLESIGVAAVRFFSDSVQLVTFGGHMIFECASSVLHPSSVRWWDVLMYMRKVGADGLPILALISFLLGLIIAFMSSLQLKQFGASMYVPSLVAIAMVRELGPIITAILVAGRSASAFAAEIGTMKVNEEVDALTTMGFNPVRFLAVPKIFAAFLVVPLLTFFADFFAILGGMAVSILGLDLTLHTYSQQTSWALTVFDIGAGVVKSIVFAVLLAGIGCHRGFQTQGGAESVGNATTSAVVAGLFLIIVTDSIFAIVLNYIPR